MVRARAAKEGQGQAGKEEKRAEAGSVAGGVPPIHAVPFAHLDDGWAR